MIRYQQHITTSFMTKPFFRLIIPIITLFIILFSSTPAYSQKMNNWDKRLWKKNIIWLEGMGASGVVGAHYERVFMLGRAFSLRADVGLSPFYMTEKYDIYAGKSLTIPIGGGFYAFPNAFKIGIGCSVLNDIFFDRIPETVASTDTTHGGSTEVTPGKNYKVRIMPYLVVEGTVANRFVFRVGYSPIIDPANDLQTTTYVTHWATIGFGYKFGK
jgi:hypothetical protein